MKFTLKLWKKQETGKGSWNDDKACPTDSPSCTPHARQTHEPTLGQHFVFISLLLSLINYFIYLTSSLKK